MAYRTPILDTTFEAGEDLSANQHYGVVLNTDSEIILPTGDGELAVGILQEDPDIGEAASVMVAGITKAVFGVAIDAGEEVSVAADGTMKVAAATENTIGICLESAGIDEVGTILINRRQLNA